MTVCFGLRWLKGVRNEKRIMQKVKSLTVTRYILHDDRVTAVTPVTTQSTIYRKIYMTPSLPVASLWDVLDDDTRRHVRRHEAALRLGDALQRAVTLSSSVEFRLLGDDDDYQEIPCWDLRLKEIGDCRLSSSHPTALAQLAEAVCIAAGCHFVDPIRPIDERDEDIPDNVYYARSLWPLYDFAGSSSLPTMDPENRCPHKVESNDLVKNRRTCPPSSCTFCALALEGQAQVMRGRGTFFARLCSKRTRRTQALRVALQQLAERPGRGE